MSPEAVDASGGEQVDDEDDGEERIGRADKVEVGIDYIIYLEERVKMLEERLGG
jgi:hypothetical protein